MSVLEELSADCPWLEVPPEAAGWSEADIRRYFDSDGAALPQPRVLCLHGTAGNPDILAQQLAPLLRRLEGRATVHFVRGRLPLTGAESGLTRGIVEQMRKYFGPDQQLFEYGRPGEDARGWRVYAELPSRLAELEEDINRLAERPPDVVIGFSQVSCRPRGRDWGQGANMATALAAKGIARGVVLLCGARPGWTAQLPELFARPLDVPAMAIRAEGDSVTGDGPLEQVRCCVWLW